MKKNLLILAILFTSVSMFANNISISNISIPSINTSAGVNNIANFKMIKFDLTWENSWRMSLNQNNWDAAWVFVKFRVNIINGGDGLWKHASLNNTGQAAPSGGIVDIGLLNQSSAFNVTTNPGLGAFIYRNADGSGTNNFTNIQLRWNYVADGLFDASIEDIQVFAIEMVYVPGGLNFNVGGGGGTGAFTSTTISTANASLIGSGFPTGGTNTNASFPNGFNKFYCMKYEISQQQMVDFLNTLTYTQQTARTINAPNSAAGTGAYSNQTRNGIDIATPGVSTSTPAVYACNLDGDGVYGEINDGQGIACNELSWGDVAAYLDWSGLRPMTELEFEKACRGDFAPVANEFAWGSAFISNSTSIVNGGSPNETGGAGANVEWINGGVGGNPIRVGAFSSATTSRVLSGGTYYGIMEMSGNVTEKTVTAGTNPVFNGINGNGTLTGNGDANVVNWPDVITAVALGRKGGTFTDASFSVLEVSDRSTTTSTANRTISSGGRGVRVAP